jgi:Inorganic pyrophosphatase
MRTIVFFIAILSTSLCAQEIRLSPDGDFRLLSNVHLIHDIAYKKTRYQALIEVPAGTTAKWEVNHASGHLEWTFKKGKARNVSFLGYPGNYGFIPQSTLSKNGKRDGDPLDVIVLGPSVGMGSIQIIRVLGGLKLLDKGKQDNKIIAVPLSGPFSDIDSIEEMMIQFPGVIDIVRTWFEGYKGAKYSSLDI